MLEILLSIFIILTIGLSIVVYRAINRLGFYEDMYGDMYGRFNELSENIRSVVNKEIYTDDPVIKSFDRISLHFSPGPFRIFRNKALPSGSSPVCANIGV